MRCRVDSLNLLPVPRSGTDIHSERVPVDLPVPEVAVIFSAHDLHTFNDVMCDLCGYKNIPSFKDT